MTRYEHRIQNMSIVEMAKWNIITTDGYYITSDCKLFDNSDKALQHEIDWLKGEWNEERKCCTCCNYNGDEKYESAWCDLKQDFVEKNNTLRLKN